MEQISDAELKEVIHAMVENNPLNPDTVVRDAMQAAFMATLMDATPSQYLRMFAVVLREMGLIRQADTLKRHYLELVKSNEYA